MSSGAAIAVKSATGFATATGVWSLVVGGLLTVIYIVIKVAPRWRELGIAGDAAFRVELMRRVSALETELKVMNTLHDAEISVMRHRLNSETHVLDMLIALLSNSPEKAPAIVQTIKELRDEEKKKIEREQEGLAQARAAAIRELAVHVDEPRRPSGPSTP